MADLLRDWMWSEACDMLVRAERLHRAFVRPARSTAQLPAMPVWEPPADILETEREVVILNRASWRRSGTRRGDDRR